MRPRPRAGVVTGRRADQDDPPAITLPDQLPADGAAEQECAAQLYVDLQVPLVVGEVDDLLVDADAGSGHRHLD